MLINLEMPGSLYFHRYYWKTVRVLVSVLTTVCVLMLALLLAVDIPVLMVIAACVLVF